MPPRTKGPWWSSLVLWLLNCSVGVRLVSHTGVSFWAQRDTAEKMTDNVMSNLFIVMWFTLFANIVKIYDKV